jgi:hypothetical protein
VARAPTRERTTIDPATSASSRSSAFSSAPPA